MTDDRRFIDAAWRGSRALSKTGEGIDLGLDRIREALEIAGHPEASSPAILVGGTNGKGGTAAYLAGVLQSHGQSVGLFTSPHLLDLRERFRIDGTPVAKADFDRVERRLAQQFGGGEGAPELTYFERTTLLAAVLFEQFDVDFAVYEVGLGGRLDATNAIEPDLSVLTAIGRDHVEFLGDSIREIAVEKCGILRSDTPAIVGYQCHPAALDTIRRRASNTDLRIAGRDFWKDAESGALHVAGARLDPFADRAITDVSLRNAAAGAEAGRVVLGDRFDPERAAEGLGRTEWPGRFDVRTAAPERFGTSRPVEFVVDAAHNPESAEALLDQLGGFEGRVAGVVVGGMADKELDEMFRRLSGGPPVWGVELEGGRAAPRSALEVAIPSDVLREVGPAPSIFAAAAQEVGAEKEGVVLVFGSTYLGGACFRALEIEADDLVTYRQDAPPCRDSLNPGFG